MKVYIRYLSGKSVQCIMKSGMTLRIQKNNDGYGVQAVPFVPTRTGEQSRSGLLDTVIITLSDEEASALAGAISSMALGPTNSQRELRFGMADGVQGPEPNASPY